MKSKIEYAKRRLVREIKKNSHKAKVYLDDDQKMEALFLAFEKKLKLIPNIGNKAADIAALLSMIRAYVKKQYTEIPVKTILFAIGGLIYVVAPLDLVPDNIPGVGLLDDGKVLDIIRKSLHEDLVKYRKWQRDNGMI